MPGYKSLPSFMTGQAADQVRAAESKHRVGDSDAAVRLFEEALTASIARHVELPGWLCGRLAALYRTLGRYDDEVRLLERYRESQTSEEARTRYDARLSKARTIADRKRRSENGAVTSVRAAMSRPRGRRGSGRRTEREVPVQRVSEVAVAEVASALAASDDPQGPTVRAALDALCSAGRRTDAPAEQLVATLKQACTRPELAHLSAHDRADRFGAALIQLLALYYAEEST